MSRLHNIGVSTGRLLVLGIILVVSFQGCTHLEEGAITVNCGDSPGGPGRGACGTTAAAGQVVSGTTCTGGLICANNGAACSRGSSLKCKSVVISGTMCGCTCL